MSFTIDQKEALNDEYSKMIYRNEQLHEDYNELNKLYDNLMKLLEDLQRQYDELVEAGKWKYQAKQKKRLKK